MIHSPSRSNSEALAGVGLLNHPQRISDFSGDASDGELEYALAIVIASIVHASGSRYLSGFDIEQ
jgi:hypothetical protein